MISVEHAQELIFANLPRFGQETVPTGSANRRVLSADIFAEFDIPPFDNAAMDGYALAFPRRSVDCPADTKFEITGAIAAGEQPTIALSPGKALAITTGSIVPSRTDAVVMKEFVHLDGSLLLLDRAVKKSEHIRPAGEDIAKGSKVLGSGSFIDSYRFGLLLTAAVREISVFAKPTIALLATGNELCQIDGFVPGRIVSSNIPTIGRIIEDLSVNTVDLGIVEDSFGATRSKIAEGLDRADVLITSGGAGGSDFDYVKRSLLDLGAELLFDRVKIKPGKPFGFARKNDKLIFILPGNPVSALTVFELFVKPAIITLTGRTDWPSPWFDCEIDGDRAFSSSSDRTLMLKALSYRIENRTFVRILDKQGSGIFSSLAKSDCLVMIPPKQNGLQHGDTVKALHLTGS